MKYMYELNVSIVSQVNSGDDGPRTAYTNAVQRALRIVGLREGNQTSASKSVVTTPSEVAGLK